MSDAKSDGYYELQISDGDGVYMGEDAVELAETVLPVGALPADLHTLEQVKGLVEQYGDVLGRRGLVLAYYGPASAEDPVLYYWSRINGAVCDTANMVFTVENGEVKAKKEE